MKGICCSIVICLQLFMFCTGCEKSDKVKIKEGTYEHLIEKAILKFDEENGSQSHKNYDISVRETGEEWIVFFEGKIKFPGNHVWVSINKETEEIDYFPGE